MIGQQVTNTFSNLRRNHLLSVMAALLCAFLAFNALFVSDPGDSGSGIGGTGRFGGESGLGGTGAPNPGLGAIDQDHDSDTRREETIQPTPAMLADRGDASTTEVVPVDMSTLRLSPDADDLAALKSRLEAVQRELDNSLQQAANQSQLAQTDLATMERLTRTPVRIDPLEQLAVSNQPVETLIDSMEITRKLMLAETSSSLFTDMQTDTVVRYEQEESLDEVVSDDLRRRLSVPARPERPDRPSIPRSSAPSQRSIPTPPVRPLRI